MCGAMAKVADQKGMTRVLIAAFTVGMNVLLDNSTAIHTVWILLAYLRTMNFALNRLLGSMMYSGIGPQRKYATGIL